MYLLKFCLTENIHLDILFMYTYMHIYIHIHTGPKKKKIKQTVKGFIY